VAWFPGSAAEPEVVVRRTIVVGKTELQLWAELRGENAKQMRMLAGRWVRIVS
jgi:hypothetical protein